MSEWIYDREPTYHEVRAGIWVWMEKWRLSMRPRAPEFVEDWGEYCLHTRRDDMPSGPYTCWKPANRPAQPPAIATRSQSKNANRN